MGITGYTEHRLDLIQSYVNNSNGHPYIVGVNGVDAVNYDSNNVLLSVEYTIDNIKYKTSFINHVDKEGNKIVNSNLNSNDRIRSYVPGIPLSKQKQIYPTTFEYSPTPIIEDEFFNFKDEAKMGVVFPPKVYEEIFIERQRINVFETHSRLREIYTLDGLEEYRNSFYNVVKLE